MIQRWLDQLQGRDVVLGTQQQHRQDQHTGNRTRHRLYRQRIGGFGQFPGAQYKESKQNSDCKGQEGRWANLGKAGLNHHHCPDKANGTGADAVNADLLIQKQAPQQQQDKRADKGDGNCIRQRQLLQRSEHKPNTQHMQHRSHHQQTPIRAGDLPGAPPQKNDWNQNYGLQPKPHQDHDHHRHVGQKLCHRVSQRGHDAKAQH